MPFFIGCFFDTNSEIHALCSQHPSLSLHVWYYTSNHSAVQLVFWVHGILLSKASLVGVSNFAECTFSLSWIVEQVRKILQKILSVI